MPGSFACLEKRSNFKHSLTHNRPNEVTNKPAHTDNNRFFRVVFLMLITSAKLKRFIFRKVYININKQISYKKDTLMM